jgi:D-cysteine desulfhydrase
MNIGPAARDGKRRPLLARADVPWLPLADLPSPLRSASTPEGRIWIKDDGRCAPFYGGNKVRKLEFLFAEARRRGARAVATIGAAGSNHALATATWAQRLGLGCHVLHFPQPPTDHVRGNLLAIGSQRARLTHVPDVRLLPIALPAFRLATALPPRRAFWIPGGGSSAVGALGYANAALELVEQLQSEPHPHPDRIYVAAGTAGTMAGLIAGLALAGRDDIEVVGVRVTDRVVCSPAHVRGLLRGMRRVLGAAGCALDWKAIRWSLRDDQFGPGYGIPTPAAEAAVVWAREHLDLYVETTYTAKTLAALRADLAANAAARPLYWHTLNQQPTAALVEPDFGPAQLPAAYARYFPRQIR